MNNQQIAAALAHEVKNPLSLIKANVDIIKLESGTAYEKSINIINREIEKINSVIETFGQIKADTPRQRVSVTEIFIQTIQDYKFSVKNKQIDFNVINKSVNPYVWGNGDKLAILFFNILKNAVEAIEAKGRINAVVYNEENCLFVKISDNGVGVEEHILENIGKPYLTGKENGNGLGVAICKSIVREHNGEILYSNNKEGGCTVKIKFKQDWDV